MEPSREQRIWQVVHAVPEGRVATYGQVARLAGIPGLARFVGRTLSQLPSDNVLPWHRVLRADGRIALVDTPSGDEQIRRLKAEGVEVINSRVAIKRFQWNPSDGKEL